jgi:pilus assembly protein CpaE
MHKVKILITGRSNDEIEAAERVLADDPRCDTETRIISNGHVDPLHGVDMMPDLLMLCDIGANGELQSLVERAGGDRPVLVVFGPGEDTAAIRMAMKAGARDYLTLPLDAAEVDDIVTQLASELSAEAEKHAGSLHVFINGKGGSGATFLATNVAHGLATSDHQVTLVDLDLQFAGLCRYLDIKPTRGLFEAIQAIENMDEVSAEAFTTRHDSGLRLLSGRTDELHLNSEMSPEQLITMLRAYQRFNDFVIVDLPRNIDILNAAILESADRISVVMQQSFPHLHDTSRLLQILREDLGISNDHLTVVVNRYEKDSAILFKDIEKALRIENIVKIPNHYRLTSESVNTGIPLSEVNRRASVVKGLREFYQSIGGLQEPETGGAARAFQNLFRR